MIEQHGFSDATQAGEHDAAFRAAARDALEHDIESVELFAAPGQFGRALSGAWGIRIAHGIHTPTP
ncbi:hypothetical protein FMUBM48_56010 [Nocardia cyriacigeorgica]|nr:hypothetical protein FMUBM48_56010 [Nocardia cyriacigeorgica]